MRNHPLFVMDAVQERAARRACNAGIPGGREAVDELMNAFSDFQERHNDQYAVLQKQIDRIETEMNRPNLGGGTSVDHSRQRSELNKAFRIFAKNGDESRLNTLSTVSDPDGGYLVLPHRSPAMTMKLFDQSPIRRLARVETITMGDAFEEPRDSDDTEAEWVNETESRPAMTSPQLGLIRVPVEESYALIPVTQRLLDDAYYDIYGWLEGKMIDKFARQEGTACVSGDGVKKPMGFLSYAVDSAGDSTRPWGTLQYVVSGAASAITADSLIDLVYSLRAPYRRGAAWLMSSDTARVVSKLKDGNGDYLWRESLAAGTPNTLAGYPVEYSEDMPAVSAGNYPIAFGNWKLGYCIVDKLGIRFLRDPYTSKPNVLIYAYRRTGGGVMNSEAIKLLKVAAS